MSLKRVSLETAKLIDGKNIQLSDHFMEDDEGLYLYSYCPEFWGGNKLISYDYAVQTAIERNNYKTYPAPTLSELQLDLRNNYALEVYVIPYMDHHNRKRYEVKILGHPEYCYSGYADYSECLEVGLQEAINFV